MSAVTHIFVVAILVIIPPGLCDFCEVQTVYDLKGDLQIGLLLNECDENVTSIQNTYLNSAIWVTQRLNYLEATPFKLGLKIYQTCQENDVYNSIFNLYQQEDSYLIGIVGLRAFSDTTSKLCGVFDVDCNLKSNYWSDLVRSSVLLLEALNWDRNLTVITEYDFLLEEFNLLTRLKGICVKRVIRLSKKKTQLNNIQGYTIVFGTNKRIEEILSILYLQDAIEDSSYIFVPLDGLPMKELPEDSYIIQPTVLEDSQKYSIGSKVVPSTLLFEIANPILKMVTNISGIVSMNCNSNSTSAKIDCFSTLKNRRTTNEKDLTPFEVLAALKIESLMNQFSYNIYKVVNLSKSGGDAKQKGSIQNYIQIGNYTIFDQNLNIFDTFFMESSNNSSNCTSGSCLSFKVCVNFDFELPEILDEGIRLRPEAWVFAFLSISALGCFFCIAVIFFFFVRICKKDIFEGNPTLTVLLLLLVISMYCSIIPFSVEASPSLQDTLCTIRSLSVSLTYAATFSLLLSRCVILATISKEVGFMAHASGPVQIFLGIFMFSVQIALSLQLAENCLNFMENQCFLCILSYNMILLFLLICTTFFIIKSERNYKEGKYFGIAIFMITCIWGTWVPLYSSHERYRDQILCFGLVGTASSLLGCVFIPRTYVMTISVARDKFTSALPALATATSAIDIYRASTQPIYDCINVAAINANTNMIRSNSIQHPDLYSCPNMPEDFCAPKCDTPVSSDKLTRF